MARSVVRAGEIFFLLRLLPFNARFHVSAATLIVIMCCMLWMFVYIESVFPVWNLLISLPLCKRFPNKTNVTPVACLEFQKGAAYLPSFPSLLRSRPCKISLGSLQKRCKFPQLGLERSRSRNRSGAFCLEIWYLVATILSTDWEQTDEISNSLNCKRHKILWIANWKASPRVPSHPIPLNTPLHTDCFPDSFSQSVHFISTCF